MSVLEEKIKELELELECERSTTKDLSNRILKAIDKLYCYGEVFNREILKQFQKEMLEILERKDKE